MCPACFAATARPMDSVLLPLPPFWVAMTIVCIEDVPRNSYGLSGYAILKVHRIRRCRAILALDVPARSEETRIAVVRITPIHHRVTWLMIVNEVLPGDYRVKNRVNGTLISGDPQPARRWNPR